MRELILYLLLTIPVAITGFCYSYILTRPGQILSKFYGWMVENTPEWIHYPVIYCEKCTSGQMAFWLYPFWICPRFGLKYDIPSNIGFCLITIYVVGFIKQLYIKIVVEEPYLPKRKVKKPKELL